MLRLVDEADQQQIFPLAHHGLRGDAVGEGLAVAADETAGDHDPRIFLARLMDRRPELGPHGVMGQREQILRGMSWHHAQIAIRRSQGIQAFVLLIDQDRRRRIGLGHHSAA